MNIFDVWEYIYLINGILEVFEDIDLYFIFVIFFNYLFVLVI